MLEKKKRRGGDMEIRGVAGRKERSVYGMGRRIGKVVGAMKSCRRRV